jgi:hypothetical protein
MARMTSPSKPINTSKPPKRRVSEYDQKRTCECGTPMEHISPIVLYPDDDSESSSALYQCPNCKNVRVV